MVPKRLMSERVNLLLIIHGYEFATQRTPVFLRSALAARTSPLHVHVLGDSDGIRGFKEVWNDGVKADLAWAPPDGDALSLLEESALDDRITPYLQSIHPSCHLNGYAYLFLKILAAELLPSVERLIVVDPDVIVLGDIAELYREFDYFDDEQLLSMAADQSDRYYYRLQNKDDDAYSPGWKGVPFGVGVNGGMLLLHTARARKVGFAHAIADLTHIGAAESEAGGLAEFCKLAEQDTLNLAIARKPQLWRPLHCTWNYMATNLGGHRLASDEGEAAAPLTFYDVCKEGVVGSRGAPGDLLQCPCGRKVGVLHFAGGVRGSSLLASINQTVLSRSGEWLKESAKLRRARPEWWITSATVSPRGDVVT